MKNETYTLVTTNIDILQNDKNDIFLGNWCFNQKYVGSNDNVISYHWDDREKLRKDYYYLDTLYEEILEAISIKLNNYHGVNYSKNYWRIHIGYWLHLFIGTMYEKWENINQAFKEKPNINSTKVLKDNYQHSYEDTHEFLNATSSSEWNNLIYYDILFFLKKTKKININFLFINKKLNIYKNYKKNNAIKIKIKLINIYNFFFKKIIQNQKIFIYRTYTGKFFEFLLNASFCQIPYFINKFDKFTGINIEERKKNKLLLKEKNDFEKFINEMLFCHIPKCYFENFKNIGKFISNSAIPKSPKVIFSTTGIYSDDIFTRVCANQKEIEGTSFIYSQHGGAYGQIKFSWAEEHEIKIADSYLTWGWKNSCYSKIKPFSVIKKINNFKFKVSNEITNITYFVRSRSKFPSRIDSSTGANTMCKYYENCLNFFKNPLIKIFNNKIKVRFHERNFGWNHEEIWNKELPNINLSKSSDETLADVYKKNDLIIYSYIGTGFLESLALDKPNILISKLNEWPLKKDVIYYFNKLKDAGIFFETNEEALIHLKKYRYSLKEWWYNPEVVKIKNEFKTQFVNLMAEKKKMNELKIIIKQKMNNNEK